MNKITDVPVKISSLILKVLNMNEQAVKVPNTDDAIARNKLSVTAQRTKESFYVYVKIERTPINGKQIQTNKNPNKANDICLQLLA